MKPFQVINFWLESEALTEKLESHDLIDALKAEGYVILKADALVSKIGNAMVGNS